MTSERSQLDYIGGGLRLPSTCDVASARLTCSECGETYATPAAMHGDVCYRCAARRAREAQSKLAAVRQREARLAAAGIPQRHQKFSSWEQLKGPAAYMRAVGIVRDYAALGTGVLAMIGRRGAGKTQLAAVAVRDEIVNRNGSALFTSAVGMALGLKRCYGPDATDTETDWLAQHTAPDLLVVDELAELSAGEHVRSMLVHVVNLRYERMARTMLIGNVTVADFDAVVGASIADLCRETGGGLIVCDWASFREAKP